MLTRFYKQDQVWTKETELTLNYIEIDDSEYGDHDDLVESVFCILPEGHPKKCIGCNCTVEPVEPIVPEVPEVLPTVEPVAPVKKKARRKPAKK